MRPRMSLGMALAAWLSAWPARADVAAAEAAFLEAKRLMASGDVAGACPKLELSYKENPQLGTLLFMADCHEKNHQLASAWAEFREAHDIAQQRGDKRAAIASERASKLASRVPHVIVHRPKVAPPGLVVLFDGRDITAMADSELPVDFGHHELASSVAGRTSAPQRVDITRDAARVEVTVEAPAAAEDRSAPPPPPPPPHGEAAPQPPPPPAVDPARARRHRIALVTGGAGLALAGVGAYFGANAYSSWHDSRAYCDANDVCQSRGRTLVDDAKSAAWKSDVFVGVGAAAIAAGVWLWVTAPNEHVVVAPAVSARSAGATLEVRF